MIPPFLIITFIIFAVSFILGKLYGNIENEKNGAKHRLRERENFQPTEITYSQRPSEEMAHSWLRTIEQAKSKLSMVMILVIINTAWFPVWGMVGHVYHAPKATNQVTADGMHIYTTREGKLFYSDEDPETFKKRLGETANSSLFIYFLALAAGAGGFIYGRSEKLHPTV